MDSYRVNANSDMAFVDVHALIVGEVEREEYERLCAAAHDAGIEARRNLRSNSPKLTGDYRKGWLMDTRKGNGHVEVHVYNRTDWQLAHLLEDGHESHNQYGGPYRRVGPADPEHHIQRASDAGEAVLFRKLGTR